MLANTEKDLCEQVLVSMKGSMWLNPVNFTAMLEEKSNKGLKHVVLIGKSSFDE